MSDNSPLTKVDRRVFIAAGVSAAVVGLTGIESSSKAAVKRERIIIHALGEDLGDGDFSGTTAVYAHGHVDRRRFAGLIDCDDVIALLGEDEYYDEEECELPDEELVAKLLPRVDHTYARWININDDNDCSGKPASLAWPVKADCDGAFPITIVE